MSDLSFEDAVQVIESTHSFGAAEATRVLLATYNHHRPEGRDALFLALVGEVMTARTLRSVQREASVERTIAGASSQATEAV